MNLLTHDYVIQVSDRRLTDPHTGKRIDEPPNKAILFCGHVIFGYTGLAGVGSARICSRIGWSSAVNGPLARRWVTPARPFECILVCWWTGFPAYSCHWR